MKLHHLLIAATSALVGCTQYLPSVGPDYTEPEFVVPEYELPDAGNPMTNLAANCQYQVQATNEDERVIISPDTLVSWWDRFNDPVLTSIVESAVSNNVSYRIAQARLVQANWQLLGTYSAFLPKLNISAEKWRSVARENNASLAYTDLTSLRGDVYDLGLGLNWEIDVFGGSRRATESAIAAAEAAGWTVNDAWVQLAAEIGNKYVMLRMTQDRIEVARTNLVLQSETYDILKSRLDSGIGDELAVNQCAYVVEQTRAKIPTLLANEEALKNAIAILAGEMPGALAKQLEPVEVRRDWMLAPQRLDKLTIDMLRARPDVRVAERNLAAQAARIGVAKAQWFPRFFLNGSVGFESTHFSDIFKYGSVFSGFGPSMSWPIFQAGAIYSSVKAEEAKTEALALQYEHALETAYQQVRNSYSAYTQEQHRYQSLQVAVRAAVDAVTISQDLYQNGLRDFNNVLDAQRSRLSLEEEMVISRATITLDLIELYRSLGGGLERAN